MTQPIRLKVNVTSPSSEKPPIDMRRILKRIFSWMPCVKLIGRDEKLLESPNTGLTEFDD